MPLEDLAKHILAALFNCLAVTRNHRVKVPLHYPPYALVVLVPVARRKDIPLEPLVALGLALCVLERLEELVHEAMQHAATVLVGGDAGVLLPSGQVEEEVGLDEHLVGLVAQDDLLVCVRRDVLDVEIGKELLLEPAPVVVLIVEDVVKVNLRDLVVVGDLGALLGEALWSQDFGGGELFLPLGEEDVVLNVAGNDVVDRLAGAGGDELGDLRLYGRSECDGAEDGQASGGHADDGAATADTDDAEAREGN